MLRKLVGIALVAGSVLVGAGPQTTYAAQDHGAVAKHDFKGTGRETGRAGKSLGRNVKHGRVIHGGKRFGQHMGRAGKDVGKGTANGAKKVFKP
ncbi:MAG TPA: hypothetical protein VI756_01890 [Blastocatellia bacterium]